MNKIFIGDNLKYLKQLKTESVDFIYMDPPFGSDRDYFAIDEDTNEMMYFDDVWSSRGEFLDFLHERLIECHRILKPTGTLAVHCDTDIMDYIRVKSLDPIFGEPDVYKSKGSKHWRNNITWRCHSSHNSVRKKFGPIHQRILVFCKNPAKVKFNVHYTPYTLQAIKSKNIDFDIYGAFTKGTMTAPRGISSQIKEEPTWKGFNPGRIGKKGGRTWALTKELKRLYKERTGDDLDEVNDMVEKLERLEKANLIVWGGNTPYYKNYEQKGVPFSDIWSYQSGTDGVMADGSAIDEDVKYTDRGNYPTEKPLGVLNRLVKCLTDRGDVVMDPFMGSGTTCISAVKLSRSFIGMDKSPNALKTIEKRLMDLNMREYETVIDDDVEMEAVAKEHSKPTHAKQIFGDFF